MKLLNYEPSKLNIAATCPSTKVLGPGRRFVIWVQGCCFACYNCGSPEWREMKEATLITPGDLAREILKTPGIEGVTISGGEPMLQAAGLYELVKNIRDSKPLSIICYTGFTLEKLIEKGDSNIDAFISEIDVLIDGPYVDSLNDNKGLRGSSNQRIHFFRGVYQGFAADLANGKRDIEIHLLRNEYLIVGIKPKGMDTLNI